KDVDNLQETPKIRFTYDSLSKSLVIDSNTCTLDHWVETPYGKLKFTANAHYKPPVGEKDYYFQLFNLKKVTANLQERLKVSSISKLSTILDLTIRDEVPERGDDILNALLANYNEEIL